MTDEADQAPPSGAARILRRIGAGVAVVIVVASPWWGRALLHRLDFFRVRCSANRSGDPIVAEKRANSYAINYPELQAWIEMAHRPLIEVDDSAGR